MPLVDYRGLSTEYNWFCPRCNPLPDLNDSYFEQRETPCSSPNMHNESVVDAGTDKMDSFIELDSFRTLRAKHKNRCIMSYLNIDSLRHKIFQVCDFLIPSTMIY